LAGTAWYEKCLIREVVITQIKTELFSRENIDLQLLTEEVDVGRRKARIKTIKLP
jgi:hypothetical protein